MADVASDHQRFVEEDVFSLLRGDLMPVPVLPGIRVIPIEAYAIIQRVSALRHTYQYMTDIYALLAPLGALATP
jgi:hypothetical protein